MGLFSFLFDQQAPAGGGFMSRDTQPKYDPSQPTDPGMSVPHVTGAAGDLGEARTLPHMETQPGLLSRLKQPDANGMTLGDKLALSGMMMRDNADPGTVMEFQRSRLAQAQFQRQLALQQRGNQAFRAAYQNGKFDPTVYAQVMGDALDPEALAKLSTTFNPKVALQGDRIVRTSPFGDSVDVLGLAAPDYGEQIAAANASETRRHNGVEEGQGASRISEEARHNRVGEGISAGQLGVSQSHLGLDQSQQAFERQKFGAAQNPGVPVITSPTDYARLPAGTPYIAPDGSLRHKQ